MLKKHMAACLVVTAFAAAPALAQTSTSPSGPTDRPAATGSGTTSTGSPAMQPGAAGSSGSSTMQNQSGSMTQGGASSTTMSQAGSMQGQFMTTVQPNQIMASDLIGTRVIGANNESIGDINDVIVDRSGQAIAAVIGVGGFLGIGEKDVAVAFDQLEFQSEQQARAAADTNASGVASPSATGSTATTGTMGTAGTAGTTAGTGAAATADGDRGEVQRVVLRMTKDQLEAAPSFDADRDDADNATTGSTGMQNQQQPATTAPQQ